MLALAELIRGVSYRRGEARSEPDEGLVALLRANNIAEDALALEDLQYVPEARVSPQQRIREGDVVVAMSSGSKRVVGKTAQVTEPWSGTFGAFCGVLRPEAMVAPRFFGLFCCTASYRDAISNAAAGVNINNIKAQYFADIDVPVPPLAEQKRVVAKVEALLLRVRSVRQRLAAVPGILKQFRQAVLAHACSGKLTEDWRGRRCGGDASELLAEIKRKRPSRYRASNSAPVREPIPPVADGIAEYPDTWALASLDQLTCLVTSGSRGWARDYSDDGPLFVRAQNISTDRLELDGVAHVSPPASAEGQRTAIQPHDLLITITGANVTKSALVMDDIGRAYVSQHVALARLVLTELAPYLYLWIVSKRHGRAKLERDAYGAGKPGLNLTQIREMPVAVPPLAEQREIACRVEALFALADTIERRVEAATKRAGALTQSILARAFRGELVPTEAEIARAEGREYETAEQLLARIREEAPMRKPTGRRTQRRRGPRR